MVSTVLKRALPLLYFLLVSLPHHPVSDLLDRYVIIPYGFNNVQSSLNAVTAAAVVFLAAAAMRIRKKVVSLNRPLVIGLLVTAVLILLSDRLLIVNNIERIHYPQYALLAVLLRLSLASDALALLISSFAGAVDEFLQYAMNPVRTSYLDFNDIVLNILGAGFGLVLFRTVQRQPRAEISSYERNVKRTFATLVALATLSIVLFVLFGRVIAYSEKTSEADPFVEQNGRTVFVLSFERHEGFWQRAFHGKKFHVMSWAEGLLATGILIGGYALTFRKMKHGERRKTKHRGISDANK